MKNNIYLSAENYPSVMFVGGENFDDKFNPIKLNSVTMIQSNSAKYCYKNISEVGSDLAAYASGNAGKIFVFTQSL
jgi:hypothetical protein